jgi:hypothetical protein
MKIKTWILSILLTCGYLYGGVTGKVAGVITNQKTGNPLIGCNIILQGTSLGAATDLDGAYFILNIPPGTYTVKTLMIGYASSNITNVIVRSDFTTTINVSMKDLAMIILEAAQLGGCNLVESNKSKATSCISLDISKTKEVFDWSPCIRLKDGLKELI